MTTGKTDAQRCLPVGEIDVLVLFGNHATVLQAKSKKLMLPARKGNNLLLSGSRVGGAIGIP